MISKILLEIVNFANKYHIDGLVQERRNYIANAGEIALCWTNASIFNIHDGILLLSNLTYV